MADIDALVDQFWGWLYGENGHSLMYTLTGLGSTGRWKCMCGAEGESTDPHAGWAAHAAKAMKEADDD